MRRWIPASTTTNDSIKSLVIFHHGGAGFHSGYCDTLGTFLKDHGVAMIAYDQVGSGYSDRIDDVPAYFDSMDTLIGDIGKVTMDVRSEYPDAKIFAMGESFGCMCLLYQVLMEQKKKRGQHDDGATLADGYILTGPLVKVLPEMLPPRFIIIILKFLSRYFPMLATPGTDIFSTFDEAFGDPRWAAAGRSDPFVIEANDHPPKLGMVTSVLSSMEYVNDHLEDVDLPFKIFMGEKEMRVDVDAVKRLAKVAKSKDKDIEIVKGGGGISCFKICPMLQRQFVKVYWNGSKSGREHCMHRTSSNR